MNIIPITQIIHSINHTQTRRVCKIKDEHIMGELNIDQKNMKFNNLTPGIYCANFNGEKYYFDLYITISDIDSLHIVDKYNAYAIVSDKKYLIHFYESIDSEELYLDNTVNDFISMLVIDGKTIKVYKDDNYNEIRSVSNLKIYTNNIDADEDSNNYLNIILKNNIKSLPNGVVDTFILNSEQQQQHIIFRIGRKIFEGNENWKFIEDLSTEEYYVFYLSNKNVKLEDSNNNLNCSHFETTSYSDLIDIENKQNCICTSNNEEFGKGFYIKISYSLLENILNDMNEKDFIIALRRWLYNEMISNRPFIVEYALEQNIYRTVYIDEYHIKTFYNKTYVKFNDDYNISFFYKTCNNIGGVKDG